VSSLASSRGGSRSVLLFLPIAVLLLLLVGAVVLIILGTVVHEEEAKSRTETHYEDLEEERQVRREPVSPRDRVAERVDRFWDIINEMAIKYQVRQSLIQAVIHWESGGNPNAFRAEPRINDASYGLMQILGSTARAMGWTGTDPKELYDPRLNIDLGTKYLSLLIRQYNDEFLALLNYNGGPRAVRRWQRGERDFPSARYARNVLDLAEHYRKRNQRLGR
jgi:soluble lytic murein transglycosylase-like protein